MDFELKSKSKPSVSILFLLPLRVKSIAKRIELFPDSLSPIMTFRLSLKSTSKNSNFLKLESVSFVNFIVSLNLFWALSTTMKYI